MNFLGLALWKKRAIQILQFYDWQSAIPSEYAGNLCCLRHEILKMPDDLF